MATVTFRTQNRSGAYTYALAGTAKEIEAYVKAKGAFLRKDESGTPLYFTTRPLASGVEYTLDDKGYLTEPPSTEAQAIVDKLSAYSRISLKDVQKYAALTQAGLV